MTDEELTRNTKNFSRIAVSRFVQELVYPNGIDDEIRVRTLDEGTKLRIAVALEKIAKHLENLDPVVQERRRQEDRVREMDDRARDFAKKYYAPWWPRGVCDTTRFAYFAARNGVDPTDIPKAVEWARLSINGFGQRKADKVLAAWNEWKAKGGQSATPPISEIQP